MSETDVTLDDVGAGVPTGDEWESAQYLPSHAVASAFGDGDPKKKKAPTPLHRVPTGEEWEKAQRLPADAVKGLTLPLLPPPPKAPTDAIKNPLAAGTKGKKLAPFDISDPTTYANPVLRQIVNPALDNPMTTAALGIAPFAAAGVSTGLGAAVGAAMAGTMVHSIASYGWQKAAEMQLSPEDRARAEADPDRVSGESAAVQAAMLGLAPFIHLSVKSMRGPSFGEGMLEAGANGVHETLADPSVAPERTLPFQGELNDLHARSLASGADEPIPQDATHPDGFETTATGARLTTKPRAVAGLVAPESVTPGKVKPLATEAPSAPAEQHATEANALTASVKDYEAQRAAQDAAEIANADPIADLEKRLTESRTRSAAAVDKALTVRRRPQGKVPNFESEQGAELLGAAAARHGLPEDASPYHPDSPLAAVWKQGHESAAQSYPEGFSMGGALTDNRIPGASEIPKVARGTDPVEGLQQSEPVAAPTTPEEALVHALKPRRPVEAPAAPEIDRSQFHVDDGIHSRLLNTKDGTIIGTLGSYLKGEKVRALFAPVLDTPVMKLSEPPGGNPEGAVYQGARGTYNDEPHIFVSAQSAPEFIHTILEEAAHEMRVQAGRVDAPQSLGKGFDYEAYRNLPAEQSAEKMVQHALSLRDGKTTPEPSSLTPVQGTGETVTRGVSASIERRALANKLTSSLGDLPGYERMDFGEQAKGASELLASDPARALRIAKGEELPPAHLLPESVAVAVENKAIVDGDVATLRELATGKLASDATEMGRRIAAYRMRDPESPVSAIESVADARESGKDIPKMQTAEMKKMFGELKKRHPTVEQLSAILDSLRC